MSYYDHPRGRFDDDTSSSDSSDDYDRSSDDYDSSSDDSDEDKSLSRAVRQAKWDLTSDDQVNVGKSSPYLELTDQDVRWLGGIVRGKDRIRVDSGFGPNMDRFAPPSEQAARKAAVVVSRAKGLRELRFEFKLARDSPARAVDIFLSKMAVSSKAPLRRLSLVPLGKSVDTWSRFVDKFGSSVEVLSVGTMFSADEMVSAALHSLRFRFKSLGTFRLESDVRRSKVQLDRKLLRALPQVATISKLEVKLFNESCLPFESQEVKDRLACVSEVAPQCTLLKELTVTCSGLPTNVRCDGFRLDGLLRSQSLEAVELEGLALSMVGRPLSPRRHNHTLKRIRLSSCDVGRECLLLLSCFRGLEKIEFDHFTLEPSLTAPSTGPELFTRLDRLVSFSTELDGSNSQMAWLVSSCNAAPSIVQVGVGGWEVEIPAVEDLLVNRAGSLSLSFWDRCPSTVPYLCSGIERSLSLTDLELELYDTLANENVSEPDHQSVRLVLDSVKLNSSLRRFRGMFSLPSTKSIECVLPSLEELVSNNTSLRTLEFLLTTRRYTPEIVEQAVTRVVRGLRQNRVLRTVNFYPVEGRATSLVVDPDGSKDIVAMLQEGNTSLQKIEGLEYDSFEHEEQISLLLELNRHREELLSDPRRVPPELWGDVLSRISNADCNFVVTRLVRQALFGSRSNPCGRRTGQRKRARRERVQCR